MPLPLLVVVAVDIAFVLGSPLTTLAENKHGANARRSSTGMATTTLHIYRAMEKA